MDNKKFDKWLLICVELLLIMVFVVFSVLSYYSYSINGKYYTLFYAIFSSCGAIILSAIAIKIYLEKD